MISCIPHTRIIVARHDLLRLCVSERFAKHKRLTGRPVSQNEHEAPSSAARPHEDITEQHSNQNPLRCEIIREYLCFGSIVGSDYYPVCITQAHPMWNSIDSGNPVTKTTCSISNVSRHEKQKKWHIGVARRALIGTFFVTP